MRRLVSVALITAVIAAALAYFFIWRRSGKVTAYDNDDACVKEVLESYRSELPKLVKDFKLNAAPAASPAIGAKGVSPTFKTQFVVPKIESLEALDDFLEEMDCGLLPLPVLRVGDSWDIGSYPQLPPPITCGTTGVIDPGTISKRKTVAAMTQSVGRLSVRYRQESRIWGSGFMIAPGIFATTCHTIQPLRSLDPDLQLEDEQVVVDFGSGMQSETEDEFAVTSVLQCSAKQGFDVALLTLSPKNGNNISLPPPLPLFIGDFKQIAGEDALLTGYADLDNFTEKLKQTIYYPYLKPKQGKFAMVDIVVAPDRCDEKQLFDIVLDSDSTTAGASGSVVLDLLPNSSASPMVIGVHTCCSAYFPEDKSEAPRNPMACARLRRTFHNQDIGSWSIMRDPILCSILSKGAVTVDHDGNHHPISCDTYSYNND